MAYVIEQRDEQLRDTTSKITYELGFDRAPQHLVTVRMRVSGIAASSITAVMPSWTPGSYKIREYIGHAGNFRVTDASGKARPYSWRNKTSIVIDTSGLDEVLIEYVVYCHDRTVRTNHVNRFHAFLAPAAVCMYVEGRQDEIHHVVLRHDRTPWPNVSTQLSPVRDSANGMVLGALNYDLLADSPIEIGSHIVREFTVAGAKHELALCGPFTHDVQWLVNELTHIVETVSSIFGGVPYDRYVFMIWGYPGVGGGLEHVRSSVNASDPLALADVKKAKGLLSLLCHEYFHTWNVKRIRPIELGPFTYDTENYTSALWLAEGLTSYMDDLLAYRCGYLTEKEYVEVLQNEHLARLDRVPGRKRMSVRDSSFLAWVRLYFESPDTVNRFPSYYLKGGIIFLLLDLYVIDHTDGARSMNDVLKGLWKEYVAHPERGLTEAEVIAVIERSTGIQVRELLMSWLDGTEELPAERMLETVGLRFTVKPLTAKAISYGVDRAFAAVPVAIDAGWTLVESGGTFRVTNVLDEGPAQLAGVGVDDEIIAVNGKRPKTIEHLERYLAEQPRSVLTAQCDGRLYETTMTVNPKTEYRVEDVEKLTERQKKLRAAWLAK